MYGLSRSQEPRPICEIARNIIAVWNAHGKGVSPHAAPYLDAMLSLRTIDDVYGLDSAESIIAYGLSNMSTFKGEEARALKVELKLYLK